MKPRKKTPALWTNNMVGLRVENVGERGKDYCRHAACSKGVESPNTAKMRRKKHVVQIWNVTVGREARFFV